MKIKTRLLSILMLIAITFTAVPFAAFAANGFKPVDAISAAGGSGVKPGSPKPGGNNGVWDSRFQGFRITVLDYAGTPAFTFMGKDSLDLVFSYDNIDNMDYFGDGHKTGANRGIHDSKDKLNSTILTIDTIRKNIDNGSLTTAVPNPASLNQAITKLSTNAIPKSFKLEASGWVTYGNAIKRVFHGESATLDETALLYVILNLLNAEKGESLWQPKPDAYLGENPFTSEELNQLNDREIKPIELMASKKLVVSVEPIIWNKLRLSPTQYSYGVYGTQTTVGTINKWLEEGGWFNPTSGKGYGGYDVSLFGRVGRRAMVTADVGIIFPAFKKENGTMLSPFNWKMEPPKDNGQYISNNEVHNIQPGWSLHLYLLKGINDTDYTHTFDSAKGNNPHPAPNVDQPKLKKPTDAVVNIVKTYEEDGEHVGTYTRNKNPRSIIIQDEIDYKVDEWFISKEYINPSESTKWSDIKNNASRSSLGKSTTTVNIEEPNTTLYVKLVKKSTALAPSSASGPLTLGESEISKAITTMDTSIPNWGPREFRFSYGSMEGSDIHFCGADDCSGHSCSAVFGDANYRYIIENSATLDSLLEAHSAGGAFEFKMLNNVRSGKANIKGGSVTLGGAEYQTTIWRGLDVPTIASYKEDANNTLKDLLKRYNKEPAGDRGVNGVYKRNFTASLTVSPSSDLSTHSVHSYHGGTWHTRKHSAPPVDKHQGEVSVNVFRGTNSKSAGNETKKTEIPTTTPFGATTSINSAGHMVQQITPLYFYPYVKMTYMTTGSSEKVPVNVLSQFYSEIMPNDFAEAAWYNDNPNESLTMSSTQWSLHARAIDPSKPWGGRNQVLPGGALYQLSTKAHTSKVALVTWQTVVEPSIRNILYNPLPVNEYTVNKATTEHNRYVEEAKETLEQLRIVQWVNTDPTASTAWGGSGSKVKIMNGGESLSALGLSGTASTDPKYRLLPDGRGDAANQGDLDVISEENSQDTFFKVFAAPDGRIYLAKSVGSLSALANINGTNPKPSGGVTVTQILSKNDTAASVAGKLNGDAKQLNDRTLVITNLVKSLERNRGSDMGASWVSDGKWYNEAFDGVVVVRKATTLNVGLGNTNIRVAALDPKLTPPSSGQSDMLTKAYLSQFRLNDKSDSEAAKSKPPGYLASFQGQDIRLINMTDMYLSKRFFVANISVQDLR